MPFHILKGRQCVEVSHEEYFSTSTGNNQVAFSNLGDGQTVSTVLLDSQPVFETQDHEGSLVLHDSFTEALRHHWRVLGEALDDIERTPTI